MGEDIPRRVDNFSGKKKKASRAEEKIQEAAVVGLIAIGLSAAYGSIAMLRREDHWNLQPAEANALATQVQACLETLPGKSYAAITKNLEKFLPWIGLAITAGAITAPRIEATRAKRESAEAAKGAAGSGSGSGADWGAAAAWQYRGTDGMPDGWPIN